MPYFLRSQQYMCSLNEEYLESDTNLNVSSVNKSIQDTNIQNSGSSSRLLSTCAMTSLYRQKRSSCSAGALITSSFDWLSGIRVPTSLDVAPACVAHCGLMSAVEMFGRETPGSLSAWYHR